MAVINKLVKLFFVEYNLFYGLYTLYVFNEAMNYDPALSFDDFYHTSKLA